MAATNKPTRKAPARAVTALASALATVGKAFHTSAKADGDAGKALTYALAGLKPGTDEYKARFNEVRKCAILNTMAYVLAGNKDDAAAMAAAVIAFDRKTLINNGDKRNVGAKGVRTAAQQTAFDNGSKRFQRLCKAVAVESPNHGRKSGSKTKAKAPVANTAPKVEVPLATWNKLQPPAKVDHDLALTWIKEQANRLQVTIEQWKQTGSKTGKTIATLEMENAVIAFKRSLADLI